MQTVISSRSCVLFAIHNANQNGDMKYLCDVRTQFFFLNMSINFRLQSNSWNYVNIPHVPTALRTVSNTVLHRPFALVYALLHSLPFLMQVYSDLFQLLKLNCTVFLTLKYRCNLPHNSLVNCACLRSTLYILHLSLQQ
jgi:hypothetical protein